MIASSDPRCQTWVHRLDPRTKIAFSIAVAVMAAVLPRPSDLGALLMFAGLPWGVLRPRVGQIGPFAAVAAVAISGNVVSQGLFYGLQPRTEWFAVAPGLSFCREGMGYGAVQSLRLLSVALSGLLVVRTTPIGEMLVAMTRMRVPHAFAFMLAVALRFLPETVAQAHRILVAQQVRGVRGVGLRGALQRYVLLVSPLTVNCARAGRLVALAAEVRAYGPHRVPARGLRFTWVDGSVLCLLLVLVSASIWLAAQSHGGPLGGIR